MGIFPRMGQRTKVLLPVRSNLQEYNEIPELTTISSNTFIPSVQDGPTVIQRYRNLAVAAGVTLTPQYRCCGMVLVVDGDLTVNGTISMTARGAYHQPIGDHRIKNNLLPGNDILYEIDIPATADEIATFLLKEKRRYHSLDELPAIYRPTLYCRGPNGAVYAPADLGVIPAVGAAGGGPFGTVGNKGTAGSGRCCAGGGGAGNAGSPYIGGAGGAGTCYSGGAGGGSGRNANGLNGSSYGGAGGAAQGSGSSLGGGAGNPGGATAGNPGGTNGGDGTGGLLIIICTGNIQVANNGQIIAKGVAGGSGDFGGGGSGGGSINIFHGGSLTNNGSISAAGGAGGSSAHPGGGGGDGCVTIDHYNF